MMLHLNDHATEPNGRSHLLDTFDDKVFSLALDDSEGENVEALSKRLKELGDLRDNALFQQLAASFRSIMTFMGDHEGP